MSLLEKILDKFAYVRKLRAEFAVVCQDLEETYLELRQAKFLVSQAPMRNAPANIREAQASVTKYAYIHPKTAQSLGAPPAAMGYRFVGSPTIWIITPLMPEYGVIYGPFLIPGVQLPQEWLR